MIPVVPLLRGGKVYSSLDVQDVNPVTGGDAVAQVTMSNSGLIKRDLLDLEESRKALAKFTTQELLDITLEAGDIFLNDDLREILCSVSIFVYDTLFGIFIRSFTVISS